jgi:hypothetical protein
MISSKTLALSLLFVSTAALARVQLNAHIELNSPLVASQQTADTEVQLDENESIVAFSSDAIRIEAALLAEKDDAAHIQYSFFVKNAEGSFELVAQPALVAAYGDPAVITLGEASEDGQAVSLFMNVNASKVE